MTDLATPVVRSNIFLKLHPVQRVLLGLIFSFIVYLFLRPVHLHYLLEFLYLWDVFAFTILFCGWVVIFNRDVVQIREFAKREDGSLFYVFLLIIISSFSCLFAMLLLFISKEKVTMDGLVYVGAAVPALILSWLMIHTTFTFRYAHMYYDDAEGDPKKHAGGILFPEEKRPDYLDFAYFGFVIGMTFQVSDVQITARSFRRTALLHGIISFALNTFVVALTINLIAGLKK